MWKFTWFIYLFNKCILKIISIYGLQDCVCVCMYVYVRVCVWGGRIYDNNGRICLITKCILQISTLQATVYRTMGACVCMYVCMYVRCIYDSDGGTCLITNFSTYFKHGSRKSQKETHLDNGGSQRINI